MKHIIKTVFPLLAAAFLSTGCSKETDTQSIYFTAGTLYSANSYELNVTEEDREILTLRNEEERTYSLPESKRGTVVDNAVYNFFMVVPLTSQDDFVQKFKNLGYISYGSVLMHVKQCNSNGTQGTGVYKISKDENGTFHYAVVMASAPFASRGFLDDIDDICLQIDEKQPPTYSEDGWDYTSNVIVVPAREIKDMLDGLGLPYE